MVNHHASVSSRLRDRIEPEYFGSITDKELLTAFVQHNDQSALTHLVRRHSPLVWKVCRRILSHHDAEDAFQVTFLVFVRRASSIGNPALLPNWLYGVAYRTAIKSRSLLKKRTHGQSKYEALAIRRSIDPTGISDASSILDEEVNRLPTRYRSVFTLCDIGGYSRREVAERLGLPQGTVAGWLARARKILATRLEKRGVLLTTLGLSSLFSNPIDAGHSLPALSMRTCMLCTSRSPNLSQPLANLYGGFMNALSFRYMIQACAIALIIAGFGCGVLLQGASKIDDGPEFPRVGLIADEQQQETNKVKSPKLSDYSSKASEKQPAESVKGSGTLLFTTRGQQLVVHALTLDARYEIIADRITYNEGNQRIHAESTEAGKVEITIRPGPLEIVAKMPACKRIQCDRLIYDRSANTLEVFLSNQSVAFELNDSFFNSIKKRTSEKGP
ncbi:MAG: sigma-70 family RNA polymerase sigma factor [Gemmatales bacterium]